MPTPVLVERLKRAKLELTALKTAHKRGVGMLKVFEEIVEPEAPDDTLWYLVMTISFSADSTSHPFVTVLCNTFDETKYSLAQSFQQDEIEYTQGGKSVKIGGSFFSSDNSFLKILSTSPIASVSFSWSKY